MSADNLDDNALFFDSLEQVDNNAEFDSFGGNDYKKHAFS